MTALLQTILYVDDEPDIRAIVQMALELTPGLAVHTASSGVEAIAEARRLNPDLILLDVMMPGLDGPGTFVQMRAEIGLSVIPVIFMTAKAMPEEVERFRQLGAIGVIAKPFDPMELGRQVKALWEASVTSPGPLPRERPESPARGQTLHRPYEAEAAHRLKDQSAALASKFLARTRSEIPTLRELLAKCQAGAEAALSEIEHLTHRIHGTGATLGFEQVSECAGLLERAAKQCAGTVPTPLRLQELQELAERLAHEVETAAPAATRS